MQVVIRLFASYRESAGVGRIELALPDGSTARDAIRAVMRIHPTLTAAENIVVARNHEYIAHGEPSVMLADGDELALIPPVSGG